MVLRDEIKGVLLKSMLSSYLLEPSQREQEGCYELCQSGGARQKKGDEKICLCVKCVIKIL